MKPETKQQAARLRRTVETMLGNPELSTPTKILYLVAVPPLAVVVTSAFAVRHYALEAQRLVRRCLTMNR